MNFKRHLSLYFNTVIYITGTFMLLTLLVIMTVNFMRDSRILAREAGIGDQTEINTSSGNNGKDDDPSQSADNNSPDSGNKQTQVYDRSFELIDRNEIENSDNDTVRESDIRIEVINYTGVDIYAYQVMSSLEAFGYRPELKSDFSVDNPQTAIIDRSRTEYGEKIQKILKVDNYIKVDESDSEYEITIVIGNDFMTPP